MTLLSSRASDINVSIAELCLILGYMSTPGRVGLIEAQIPEEKAFMFEREFPGEPYYPITQGETTGGNIMKQGCQLRIYFLNTRNCPIILLPHLKAGVGNYVNRINRGKFIERIVKNYVFCFGEHQNAATIRAIVARLHPTNVVDFDRGYNL